MGVSEDSWVCAPAGKRFKGARTRTLRGDENYTQQCHWRRLQPTRRFFLKLFRNVITAVHGRSINIEIGVRGTVQLAVRQHWHWGRRLGMEKRWTMHRASQRGSYSRE